MKFKSKSTLEEAFVYEYAQIKRCELPWSHFIKRRTNYMNMEKVFCHELPNDVELSIQVHYFMLTILQSHLANSGANMVCTKHKLRKNVWNIWIMFNSFKRGKKSAREWQRAQRFGGDIWIIRKLAYSQTHCNYFALHQKEPPKLQTNKFALNAKRGNRTALTAGPPVT